MYTSCDTACSVEMTVGAWGLNDETDSQTYGLNKMDTGLRGWQVSETFRDKGFLWVKWGYREFLGGFLKKKWTSALMAIEYAFYR